MSYHQRIVSQQIVRIAKFQVAVVFEIQPELILSLGPTIKALAQKSQGQIHEVSGGDPNFPPDVPRIVIQTRQFLVNISLNRFDIHVVPPRQLQENHSAAIQFAKTMVTDVLKDLLQPQISYKWSGVVVQLKFPSAKPFLNAAAAVEPVFKRLVTFNPSDKPLSSFEMRFGYQEGDLFRSVKIGGYSTRNLRMRTGTAPSQPSPQVLNTGEITETGIQVFVDVNNKPSAERKGPHEDLQRLFEASEKSITSLPNELKLSDILL